MDSAFWDEQAQYAYSHTAQVLFEIFLAGGAVGAAQLPRSARLMVDWDVFSQAAIDYLELYRLQTVPGVTDVIRTQAVKAIDQWIKGGEPLPALVQKFENLFGIARAKRIAVTEVTRAYAGGNIAAWKTTGLVTAKKFQTARDERVCPVCGPMHGKVVEIDSYFQLDQLELPPELARSGKEFVYYMPPLHPNCRCWLLPVVSEVGLRRKLQEALNET